MLEKEELLQNETEKAAGGAPVYHEGAYPGGTCPLCGAGVINVDPSPAWPATVGVCSHCHAAFFLD